MKISKLILTEFQECVLFHDWITLMPFVKEMTHHSPNELCSDLHQRINQKKQGMSSGFPDYEILIPNATHYGLFIEMKKSDKRNHAMPDHQVAWGERLKQRGYAHYFAFGFDDAKNIVENYLISVVNRVSYG